ncbi:hypothetical protein E2542_SST22944 [Spatholobus suberectus]|nr:hypothetical protein E2542_SST22944 [Spatholobus suberectus]
MMLLAVVWGLNSWSCQGRSQLRVGERARGMGRGCPMRDASTCKEGSIGRRKRNRMIKGKTGRGESLPHTATAGRL